jgi:hypothetical protein
VGNPKAVRAGRLTARFDGEFVVFLIGMRINRPLMVHKWWPVTRQMPRMLSELYTHRQLGFLHAEMWVGRTVIMVQYWRSMEQLLDYARARESAHLPAWREFNRAIGIDGSVGIWHETYQVQPGDHENVYVNMPPFGFGHVGELVPASHGLHSAAGRLRRGTSGPG